MNFRHQVNTMFGIRPAWPVAEQDPNPQKLFVNLGVFVPSCLKKAYHPSIPAPRSDIHIYKTTSINTYAGSLFDTFDHFAATSVHLPSPFDHFRSLLITFCHFLNPGTAKTPGNTALFPLAACFAFYTMFRRVLPDTRPGTHPDDRAAFLTRPVARLKMLVLFRCR